MNRRRFVLGAAGLACLVAASRLAGGATRPVDRLVALLGNDYFLVAAIGGVGLLVAVATAASGRPSRLVQADLPEPERPISVPSPGSELDDCLDGWRTWLPVVGRERRATLHARLRTDAVETLQRTTGCDRSTAERRVAEGDWPADPGVAAFLAPTEPPRPPLVGWLLALLSRETWTQRQVRRAALTLVRLDAAERVGSGRDGSTQDGGGS